MKTSYRPLVVQSTESFDGIDTNSLQKIFLALGGYQRYRIETKRISKYLLKTTLLFHESFWYSWWFSDEPTIDRTDGDYTKWSFYGSGERLHRDKLQPRRRPLRYSQMFFGAINYDKPSRIVPVESDPQSGRGGVTGRRILACLQSYLPGLIEEGETFQHDNSRTFKAKIVQG
ncbi:Acyl-CoA synthetase short-chain family member 3 [Fusarium oxysporum f. sp. albedinis]|nr:Acyl-CoA synthetase short-chain family member 3 [Fusarium oxysporum f. sp. albedinis]